MNAVTLQYFKYPDSPHWRHELIMLGEDEHGTWLGAPEGTILQRGNEPEIVWNEPFVQLVQHEQPWMAIFNTQPRSTEIYVDITTVPRFVSATRIEAVDVDLDVVRRVGGELEILDEDEFQDHIKTLQYPEWLVDQARATTAAVLVAMETQRPPFDGAHLPWFRVLGDMAED